MMGNDILEFALWYGKLKGFVSDLLFKLKMMTKG
jgi:hypothetical protein